MKILQTRKSIVGGVLETCTQGIAADKIAFATSLFRDKIYTDKLKAALVETVCNAVDEHRKHNINECIDIILTKKELCIRDHALGLSDDDVMKIFFQYFESTKSNTNDGIGGFGIGAKAPGSYTDLYYVVSYFNGEKTLFMSSVNGLESQVSKVYKEPCDPNDTGICVRIPLVNDYSDFNNFVSLIKDIYIQIGFYSDKEELKVAITSDYLDYDDYLEKDENYKNNARSNFSYDKSYQLKQKRISNDETSYIKDEVIILEHERWSSSPSLFKSSFWNKSAHWAYDGDVCYQINIPREIFDKYKLKNNNLTYILLFKRGELPISPTRESIEITDFVNTWFEHKLKNIAEKAKVQTQEAFDEKFASNFPLYDVKKFAEETIKSSSIINKSFFSWPGKYLMDIIDSCRKAWRGDDDELEAVFIKQKDSWNRTTYSKLDGKIIFIICDEPLKIPYSPFYLAFKKYLNTLHGQDYVEKVFLKENTRFLGFINSDEKKEAFNKFKEDFTLDDKELLRENIDYYYLSDILKHNDWKRPAPAKRSKTLIIKNSHTDAVIPEDEYSQTLIYAPSDYQKNTNYIKKLVEYYPSYKNTPIFSDFGIKHISKCYKDSFQKFKDAGCIDINDLNLLDLYYNHLKENKISFIPTVIRNYTRTLDLDLEAITGYTFLELDRPYGVNAEGVNLLINSIYGDDVRNKLINRVIDDFTSKLLELSEEELSLIYDSCAQVSIDTKFTNGWGAIYNKIQQFKSQRINTNTKLVQDKITNILKAIDFEVRKPEPPKQEEDTENTKEEN